MSARYAFAIAVFVVGCGGSTSDDVPSDQQQQDTGSSTTDSSTTTTDSSTTTTDSSTTTTDSSTTTDDSSTTTTDGSTSGDAKGVDCGGKVCGDGEVCCASAGSGGPTFTCTMGSCPDGGATITCDGPEDCSGGKICCAEADVTGTGFMCGFKSGVADCRATCNTMIPTMCPGKATIRPCHAAADCTESGYKNCCTFSGGGGTATFCAPDLIKAFASKCY